MIDGLDMDLDLSLFDKGFGSKLETRYHKPKRTRRIKQYAVKYERARDMVAAVSEQILAGETVHALLSGNFIFGDFIEAFAVDNNLLIEDLTISTLSFGKDNVHSLKNLIVGDYVQSLNIVVSDYFYSHNRDNCTYTHEHLDIDNKFQLAVAGVHTKVTLIRSGDRRIVMTGSANLRSSRSVEEVTIQDNPELYDFHKIWHDEVLTQYATINKSIRATHLWERIK